MAINYPGPFQLRIKYSSPNISPGGILGHVLQVNLALATDPGQGLAFNNYVVDVASGTNTALNVVVEDFLAVIDGLFNTTTSFDVIELWKYPVAQSFDAIFHSTYDPTIVAGTSASAGVAAAQDIYTFRTQEGGTMKLSFMESTAAAGLSQSYSQLSGAAKDTVDYIIGGGAGYGAPFLGRDTSYPFAFSRRFPGQNEALFKQRYRPTS